MNVTNHDGVVRFGPFELDPNHAELRKHGRSVRLAPQPFKVLSLLVSQPGKLISREELSHHLWNGTTFVDFEQGLNFCVRRIRAVLDDDAEHPRYIETVPRRGYRFIAPVDLANLRAVSLCDPGDASGRAESETREFLPQETNRILNTPKLRRSRRPWTILGLGLGLCVLIATGVIVRTYRVRSRPGRPPDDSSSLVIPLLTLPGEERMPAFSPDSSRVAFVWHAPEAKKSGIYVLVVGSQTLLRISSNADDYSPAWSPDGRYIAFLRDSGGKFSIQLVTALGGPERTIHTGVTNQISQGSLQESSLSFSPDGSFLAFSEADPVNQEDSIELLSINDLSVRRLTSPPQNMRDRFPAFSPLGDKLVFVRSAGPSYIDELYVVSLPGGDTKQLTFDHHRIFGPPTFTRDGQEIVFSSNRAGLERLWRISTSGGTPKAVAGAGPGTLYPAVSLAGNYLAYERNEDEENIWRLRLKDETHVEGRAEILIPAGDTNNFLPQYSPDGGKIAFQSDRSGYSEIWLCDANGSNLTQLTNFQSFTGSPRWSMDSRYLAFDTRVGQHSEIDVIEFPAGHPQRAVSFPGADTVVPSWSRDGHWIYFASNRGSKLFHIWKIAVHDGTADPASATQVTTSVGYAAFESDDGRLFFTGDPPRAGIWVAPQKSAKETALWKGPGPDQWSNWAPSRTGMYVVASSSSGPVVNFLSYSTGQVSRVATLAKPLFYGFALSPDGKSLIFSQQDHNEREILIINNFH